jgi:hypothetical protein
MRNSGTLRRGIAQLRLESGAMRADLFQNPAVTVANAH